MSAQSQPKLPPQPSSCNSNINSNSNSNHKTNYVNNKQSSRKRKKPPPPSSPPPIPLASKEMTLSTASSTSATSSTAAVTSRQPIAPPFTSTSSSFSRTPPTSKQFSLNLNLPPAGVRPLPDVDIYTKQAHIGQGQYGIVWSGKHKKTQKKVALKAVQIRNPNEGYPLTCLREINVLKKLQKNAGEAHSRQGLVKLEDLVMKYEGNTPSTLFLVFEFCSYDLYGLLTTREIPLTLVHLKSFAVQLLKALHFTHSKNILHRDLKTANILVTSGGVLKIADWGLAREWNGKGRLTVNVVTLWYRAPELILGGKTYGKGVDVWSVGCILGEMFRSRGSLFSGHDEATQINAIFDLLGVPPPDGWVAQEPFVKKYKEFTEKRSEKSPNSKLSSFMKGQSSRNISWVSNGLIDLMQKLLEMDPNKRITAGDAFIHEFFIESPRWAPPHELNMNFKVESVHEYAS
eukprot:CAMPEP_0118642308 /NCGR_PEP_ID=MMETSP0785-20121206/5767_1 /TAXON_ID=91992 /ORGANISM="Bolidomonas pacifica, Strain CCMP 1866" /LENGTH=458 /DNA_ID=CAMNT_0006533853 /DNA_START=587 /DNA_END=1960 /DNA_ORIENTATION=+